MDNISIVELIKITQIFRDSLDVQFQYWLAATFAVIVASFIAGDKLNKYLRIIVSVLYASASVVFFISYLQSASNYSVYIAEVNNRGAPFLEPLLPIAGLRMFIFIVGAATTLWFLNINKTPGEKSKT